MKKNPKEDRFLRGRQIADLIYEYFRVTGAHDSVENYADLFTISPRNDDIQGRNFYCLWRKSRMMTSWKVCTNKEYESLRNSRPFLELYNMEIYQKKLGPDYHRWKTMVKRSIEQDIRNKNFGSGNGNYEKNAVVRNQGTKQRVQRILGDCWQWETNGQCEKGHNCRFRHDINKRGKVTPPNPSSNSFMQQNERKSSRTRSPRGKSPSGRMSR